MTSRRRRALRENFEAAAYLAPAGIILLIFWFVPVVITFGLSFFDATALTPIGELNFVGLAQYRRALGDAEFVQSIWNTINFALYSIPTTLALALIAAMLMNSQIKGRAFFRTAFFLPYVTTWVAIAIVWNYVYHRDFGLANWALVFVQENLLGIDQPVRMGWLQDARGIWEIWVYEPLLGDYYREVMRESMKDPEKWPYGIRNLVIGPSLANFSIIVTSVWRDLGYFMVIFLAGLQNIDKSYYEAASIDGASTWQKFWAITFPLLSPVTFFLLVISMIGAFMEFVPAYVMTPGGGPGYSTAPIVFHLFSKGFTGQWELSYAAALAYILTIMILTLTFVQNKIVGQRVEYDA